MVNQLYPEVGVASVQLLKHVGCEVHYTPAAACCGQPALNAGHLAEARAVAKTFIETYASDEVIVCPSGSCTAMVRNCYGELFAHSRYQQAAEMCSARIFELSQFLVKERLHEKIEGCYLGSVGLHLSCHSLRELGVKDEPALLLERITGCSVVDVGPPVCCGFGGLFCVKYDGAASGMAKTRLEMFLDKGLETVVSNDAGCLMHLRKEAQFYNYSLRIVHLAEFLAEALKLPKSL